MTVTTTARKIRVAVLRACKMPATIAKERGEYQDIFRTLLERSVAAYNAKRPASEHIAIELSSWDVEDGEYPPRLDGIDVLLITGSPLSAYDDEQWIKKLDRYVQDVYQTQPQVKIFGGCFGHQLVSQALLGSNGAFVERSPRGWEIGVHPIDITPEFAAQFPDLLKDQKISFQFLHADHVVLDQKLLPPSWILMGSSERCNVQGLLEPGRVLTYQGHPEFDGRINEYFIRSVSQKAGFTPDEMEEYLQYVNRDDTSTLAGEVAIEFMLSCP